MIQKLIQKQTSNGVNTKSQKILVVEDNIHLLKTITHMLSLRNYQVIEALDGVAGLKALEQKPDLIWLDLYLPKLDGLEFLDKVRAVPAYSNIPIIIVTVSRGKDEITQHLSGVKIITHFIKSDVKLAKIVDVIDQYFSKT